MLRLLRTPALFVLAKCGVAGVAALPSTATSSAFRAIATPPPPPPLNDLSADGAEEFEYFDDDFSFLSELFDESSGDLFNFIPAEDRRFLDRE